MSETALSREQVRDVDRRAIEDFGMSGLVLMENAGRGAAEWLLSHHLHASVVICAGKGNNGGDGFVIARHLDIAGIAVRVLLFCDPGELRGDAAANYRIVEAANIPHRVLVDRSDLNDLPRELASADWIVDALLGTGTKGSIREPYTTVIEAINAAGRPVLAIDLPSGLDCDTGQPLGPCIRATETVTFVARKRGFDAPEAREFTGPVHVVGIGVPRILRQAFGIDEVSVL
ncbi:MAG TPA: NAD(P)H-hydrate epimerase, partial [Planctomycetaceae bacterium]|nr:NAD(P)H-hydrate epimerase [Planctomycetaceae bacterium]